MMMQESVYTKLVLNPTAAQTVMRQIEKSKPQKGLIQALMVTEKQFSNIHYILGEPKTDVLDTDERITIL